MELTITIIFSLLNSSNLILDGSCSSLVRSLAHSSTFCPLKILAQPSATKICESANAIHGRSPQPSILFFDALQNSSERDACSEIQASAYILAPLLGMHILSTSIESVLQLYF